MRTQFDRVVKTSNPGNAFKKVYSSKINKLGHIEVYETGKEDIYKYINSFADSVDINVLIKKFEAGDINALNKKEAQFLDLTELPNDYFEVVNKMNEAKQLFAELPLETKKKFDNNFNKFAIGIGSIEWYKTIFGEDYFKDKNMIDYDKKELQDMKIEEVKDLKGDGNNE